MDRRKKECWSPYRLDVDVSGSAFDIQVVDKGSPLYVTVVLEPTNERYQLEFDRMDVIAYLVGTTDRINRVTIDEKNGSGGIYIVKGSDFHERESEWPGQYTADGTHHIAIPGFDLTIEILTLELPIVTKLEDDPPRMA